MWSKSSPNAMSFSSRSTLLRKSSNLLNLTKVIIRWGWNKSGPRLIYWGRKRKEKGRREVWGLCCRKRLLGKIRKWKETSLWPLSKSTNLSSRKKRKNRWQKINRKFKISTKCTFRQPKSHSPSLKRTHESLSRPKTHRKTICSKDS